MPSPVIFLTLITVLLVQKTVRPAPRLCTKIAFVPDGFVKALVSPMLKHSSDFPVADIWLISAHVKLLNCALNA